MRHFNNFDCNTRNCANVSARARELEIDRTVLYHWHELYNLAGEQRTASTGTSLMSRLRKQVKAVKRLQAEKTLKVDFSGALQKSGPQRGTEGAH